MKVKANYGISCDKGYFETGEVFEIDEKDLPMYGDAVTVVERASGNGTQGTAPAVPDKPELADNPGVPEEPEAEKPKPTRSRARTRKA